MSRTSVREVSGGLPVGGDGGDHRYLQGFGDLISPIRVPLTHDDQTQLPAIWGAEPRMIPECRQVDSGTHDRQ